MDDLETLKNYFETQPDVAFAFLFGSRSKGLTRRVSDYDIAVYFKPENPRIIEFEENKAYPLADKIWADLDSLLKAEVDLVVLNRATTSLAADIVTKGQPIIIKDRDLFLKFLLVATDWGEWWHNFVFDYYDIYQRSKSLSDQDKKNLEEIILFLENELKEFYRFKELNWEKYQKDFLLRKAVERWVEGIMNVVIDSAKILLSGHKKNIPEKSREAVLLLGAFFEFKPEDLEKLADWVKLRNILAHEYLDFRFEKIKDFTQNSEPMVKTFIESVKKTLS